MEALFTLGQVRVKVRQSGTKLSKGVRSPDEALFPLEEHWLCQGRTGLHLIGCAFVNTAPPASWAGDENRRGESVGLLWRVGATAVGHIAVRPGDFPTDATTQVREGQQGRPPAW